MARRGRRFRRGGGGGGINRLLKGFAIGAVAGAVSPRVPVLNSLPNYVAGAGAAYMFGGKNIMTAGAGAVGAMVGSPYLSGFLGGSSGSSITAYSGTAKVYQ